MRNDLERVLQSPFNQQFQGAGGAGTASSYRLHAKLKKLLDSENNLTQQEYPSREIHHLKDLVSSTVRELDPNHPFLNETVNQMATCKLFKYLDTVCWESSNTS